MADSGYLNSYPYPSNVNNQGAAFPTGYNNNSPPFQYGQPMVGSIPQVPMPMPTIVTTQQNVMVIPQPSYRDYLGLSIMNLILCCFPIGIAATVFSCKVRESLRRGDMISAASDSRTAFKLNMVSLGLGIAGNLAWIAYVIYTTVTNQYGYSHYYSGYGYYNHYN
ncbi:proline rich transmembrane protein 1B-like [Pelobates fuscus]|uniref:proline rich transmembrane protein 1B-like n=1 Tax=Pelobates fuscus TaxID=191477 RepID=UPI002FE48A4A